MIKNIQKIFMFLTFFLITKNVFCAENQMTLQDIVPFVEKTRRLYEDLQVSYTSQALTIQKQDETIRFLQSENQTHTDKILQLMNQQIEQNKINNELIDKTERLLTAVEKFALDIQELQKRKVIINSPTGNNNHHNMVIKNTSTMGSVNIATNNSSVSTGINGKTLFVNSIIFVGLLIAYIKWYS